jgi:hypothetical protein
VEHNQGWSGTEAASKFFTMMRIVQSCNAHNSSLVELMNIVHIGRQRVPFKVLWLITGASQFRHRNVSHVQAVNNYLDTSLLGTHLRGHAHLPHHFPRTPARGLSISLAAPAQRRPAAVRKLRQTTGQPQQGRMAVLDDTRYPSDVIARPQRGRGNPSPEITSRRREIAALCSR